MNETSFWNYIEKSSLETEKNTEQQIAVLGEELENLEKQHLFAFGSFVDFYFEQLAQSDIWNAGRIILGEMDEDKFDNFRYWIILQGKDIFENVLTDSDCLALDYSTEIVEYILTHAENLGILADTVYENNTEKTDFYPKMEKWQEDHFELDFDDIDCGFPESEILLDLNKLKDKYPKLCEKFL
jgi:hypothetical protein